MPKDFTKQTTSKGGMNEAPCKCTYTNCNFTASTRRKVREHENSEHETEIRLQCLHPGCLFDSTDAIVIDRHYQMQHAFNNPRSPPLAPVQNIEHPQPAAPVPEAVTVKPQSAALAPNTVTVTVEPQSAVPAPNTVTVTVEPQSAALAPNAVTVTVEPQSAVPAPNTVTVTVEPQSAVPAPNTVTVTVEPQSAVPAPNTVTVTVEPQSAAPDPNPVVPKVAAAPRLIAPIPKRTTAARKRSNTSADPVVTEPEPSVASSEPAPTISEPTTTTTPKPVADETELVDVVTGPEHRAAEPVDPTPAPKPVRIMKPKAMKPIINKILTRVIRPRRIPRRWRTTSTPSGLRNDITADILQVSTARKESRPFSIDDSDNEDEKPAKKQKLSPSAEVASAESVPELKVVETVKCAAPVPAPAPVAVPAPVPVPAPVTAQVTEWSPPATTVLVDLDDSAKKTTQDNEDEDEEDSDGLFCDAD